MTLLDIYKTEPKHLLNVAYSDFDDAQWQELVLHFGQNQNDPYDADVMRYLLPIMGDRILWLETTLAQQFLYTAIYKNDVQMVDFILNTFENIRNGDGYIEGWEGYVEIAVDHKLNHSDWSYAVLDRLLQNFDNTHGWGLLRCVQRNNSEVLRYILPHSDLAHSHCIAYRWALVYGFTEIEQILEPHSSKFHALCGFQFEQWVESEDKQQAQQAKENLHSQILSGMYDHDPLALLYRVGLKHGSVDQQDLTQVSDSDRTRLALLWRASQTQLAKDVLTTVSTIDDELSHAVTEDFRNDWDIVIPRLTPEQRQNELYNCAHYPENYTFAQQLVAYGADPQQTLVDLNESVFSGLGFPALKKYEDARIKALETLQHWINQWQAQSIYDELGPDPCDKKPSKL